MFGKVSSVALSVLAEASQVPELAVSSPADSVVSLEHLALAEVVWAMALWIQVAPVSRVESMAHPVGA
jgi:hypothetical protein